jgi:hypothetical protein
MSESNHCRILDDDELERAQWRKDVNEVKIQRIFSSETKSGFPSAFQKAEHSSTLSFFKKRSPKVGPQVTDATPKK